MLRTNYLIINRKPQEFLAMELAGKTLIFYGEGQRQVGSLTLGDNIYAALYCDDVLNVTLVDSVSLAVETILWTSSDEYEACKDALAAELDVRLSSQNKKINRYGEEIAKKLEYGVELHVIDAVKESDVVTCPDCGMQSPKGTPYCMDCGAELPM